MIDGLYKWAAVLALASGAQAAEVLKGQAALGDWTTDAPGVRRHITTAELPKPYATKSVDSGSQQIERPEGAWPKAPEGFKVTQFAIGLGNPRSTVTAPNGDVFVADSQNNNIRVLRDADGDGKAEISEVYASGLSLPFGIAFYPPGDKPTHVYVGNTESVVKFAYKAGDLKASGKPVTVVPDIPGGGRLRGGGHWTRDVQFSKDGAKMWVSVGSHSNVDDDPEQEARRASILQYNADGTGYRLFASGIRNPVGLAINPATGDLWTSVNERDELGDHLVPDYVTRVKDGGFYGWPWFYTGGNQDPRHEGKHPELRDKVIVPDVLLQSHSASLDLTFYTGDKFPAAYRGIFVGEHGSWNRSRRTGYKVIRVLLKDNAATGEYEDFLTGFVTADGEVWGRPVGVTTARDGALLVTDDAGECMWRVEYTGAK